MEILQLETFLAVATYGGFHRAAEALRISQPAVSARISTLEESLGTRLFEREHGKFSLSPSGKALRPHAEQLLRQVAVARQAVHRQCPRGLCRSPEWTEVEGCFRTALDCRASAGQPPLTPQPTFTKTKSRGSSWVERLSESVFFFDDGYAPFPTIHKSDVGGRGQ